MSLESLAAEPDGPVRVVRDCPIRVARTTLTETQDAAVSKLLTSKSQKPAELVAELITAASGVIVSDKQVRTHRKGECLRCRP